MPEAPIQHGLTRNVDERNVAEGGGGASSRPMLARDRGGFIDLHDLWSERQYAAAGQMRRVIDELGLDRVRFAFVDQHGVLRGKTVLRQSVSATMRSGITAPSSLLVKDTSGASVFPVFSSDTGVGVDGFSGASDIVMVPDPTTFRVLPWADRTGWVLCDVYFPDGSPVPFCTRSLLRDQLARLAERGYDLTVGVELELHVFRDGRGPITADRSGDSRASTPLEPTTPGAQLLHEERLDRLEPLVEALSRGLTSLDLPLRSIELEFGPSQLEITLDAAPAVESADMVVIARTAIRQIARRLGYHATFMARPQGLQSASIGWHLHQSLRHRPTGRAAFAPDHADHGPLSLTGQAYLEGLLRNAPAAAAFATPSVNGYKRYQSFSLAPDRIAWGIDNKGAMLRLAGGADCDALRMENRSGEPGANPYLYVASQVISGLAGLNDRLDLRVPTTNPYADDASSLPRSLGEALDALDASGTFRDALGDVVVDWYTRIKRAEWERYLDYVSDWEQREYVDLV